MEKHIFSFEKNIFSDSEEFGVFDLETTNFWNYVNDNFDFALTGTSIRWESSDDNGTDHPNISIQLENGYTLNINNIWFVAEYSKGIQFRSQTDYTTETQRAEGEYSTWWIQDLDTNKKYNYNLYNYVSSDTEDQHYTITIDVIGNITNTHEFSQGEELSVITDTISPNPDGEIFFECTNPGEHGGYLSWIRINEDYGLESDQFAGGNPGSFCTHSSSVAGGITTPDDDWAYGTRNMSYYKARLVDPNYYILEARKI